MGTRSLTIFGGRNEEEKEIAVLYRQYDGYQSEHGKELRDFLAGHKVVNGLSGNPEPVFNGLDCLAASVVAHFKTEPGNFYLKPAGTRKVGEEYKYTIWQEKGTIYLEVSDVYDGGHLLYSGPVDNYDPFADDDAE